MEDKFSLCGKVAVVTGATGTFGGEFCRTFAEHGADIVIASRSMEKGEVVAQKLRQEYGVDAKVILWDATDVESIKALALEAKAWKGHVDVLN